MARPFSTATAEHVVAAVEAVSVLLDAAHAADAPNIATFVDLPEPQTKAALHLAVDLGLLSVSGGIYAQASPLALFLRTPDELEKAAVLRVVLESYGPFKRFRERLLETGDTERAAQQTKAVFDLDAHASEIKETLVSLGTYAQALTATGGGRYTATAKLQDYPLQQLVSAAQDSAGAEARIRQQIGVAALSKIDSAEVVEPLSSALRKAAVGNGNGAVQDAGNAVESFLSRYGTRVGTNVSTNHGINAKASTLHTAGHLPKKLLNVSKYLGHVRNAADHGVDPDIGQAWVVTENTGRQYVGVACSFIEAVVSYEDGGPPVI